MTGASNVELLPSSVAAFTEALKGGRGSLDAWLEVNDEREVAAHVEAYARACVEANTETLRAEVGKRNGIDPWAVLIRAQEAEARAERLAEALRGKASEWEAWGTDPNHPIAGCPHDERANEIFQRCANELRALLHDQEKGK